MKRRLTLILAVFAALVMLTSCATTEKEEVKPYITVTASSTVAVIADTASFSITAEALESTTEEARNASSDMIANAVEILKDEYGITDDEITTDYMNISPYYQWLDSGRTLMGQKATQTLTITLRNGIEKAGKVYDRLSVLDGISISSISYSKADTSAEESYARVLATKNALEKAEDYAEGASMTVGKVLSLSEGSNGNYNYSYSKNAVMLTEAAAATEDSYTSTTYYAGDLSVSATVTAVFELN